MANIEKCAHPSCECRVDTDGEFGNFCGAHCESSKDIVDLRCECGHPGCDAAMRGQTAGQMSERQAPVRSS